jgi:hypothetical protein
MEKSQRQEKERKINVGELAESVECVKKNISYPRPFPKKSNYLSATTTAVNFHGAFA